MNADPYYLNKELFLKYNVLEEIYLRTSSLFIPGGLRDWSVGLIRWEA